MTTEQANDLIRKCHDLLDVGFISEPDAEALVRDAAQLLRKWEDSHAAFSVALVMDTLVWFLVESRKRHIFADWSADG